MVTVPVAVSDVVSRAVYWKLSLAAVSPALGK